VDDKRVDDDKHSLYAYVMANLMMLLVERLGLEDDAFVLKQLSLVQDFQMMVVILNNYQLLLLYSLMSDLVEVVVVVDDEEDVYSYCLEMIDDVVENDDAFLMLVMVIVHFHLYVDEDYFVSYMNHWLIQMKNLLLLMMLNLVLEIHAFSYVYVKLKKTFFFILF
jgi:hypothetical protein